MTINHIIHPDLERDCFEILDLSLSKLMLFNNANFPWVILIPRKNDVKEITDLTTEERIILMEEISLVSKVMQDIFKPAKLNVASLGNIVSQLHIHIIARFKNDIAWPHPTFGREKKDYSEEEKNNIIKMLSDKIQL